MPVPVKQINDDRFSRWKTLATRKHATPIVLITVGHDHRHAEVTVFTTEDRTDKELLVFLKHAVAQLEQKIAEQN